jgi:hypothetical protein
MIGLSPRWRLRRILVGLTIGGFITIAALCGGYAYLHFASNRDLIAALAETDQLDPYWRLEDLEAQRRPTPPANENGYEQLLAAVRAAPAKPWPQPSFPKFERDPEYQRFLINGMEKSLRTFDRLSPVLLNDEQARVLRAELERAKDAIGLLRKMVDFPSGRGPSLAKIEELASRAPVNYLLMLDAGKMLLPDARVRIFDGDIAGALQDVIAVLHMSRTLEDRPTLMAQLVLRALQDVALDILELTLAGGSASEEELAVTQRELERAASTPGIVVGLRGERASINHFLEAAQTGEISKEDLRSRISTVSTAGPGKGPDRLVESIRFALFYGNLPSERARALRGLNELIKIGQLPPRERLLALIDHKEQAPKRSKSYSAWTNTYLGIQFFNAYLEDELSMEVALSCTIAAVAAERFRLANQRWPQSADELTPRYLKSAPIDLYSGQPLQFVRKGSELIIYSIGADQKDDGGTVSRTGINARGKDIGFVLQEPAQRRRPGAPFEYPKR